MLSYQHEYHAGNHADVLKHICLVRILTSLCKKDKPFTVIDSHAGAGRFHLDDERMLKTGEADSGIKKLLAAADGSNLVPAAVADYINAEIPYFSRSMYAGSAELERIFARKGDKLFMIEKHPQAFASLKSNIDIPIIRHDGEEYPQVKATVINQDSYEQLNALTPPSVKRGLILCDPSYEDASDYAAVTKALKNVRKKWNTAIIALWYPLLARRKNETAQMLSELEDFSKIGTMPCESFRCELKVKNLANIDEKSKAHLSGSGMLVINPPWQLKEDMMSALEFLRTKCGFQPQ